MTDITLQQWSSTSKNMFKTGLVTSEKSTWAGEWIAAHQRNAVCIIGFVT